MKRAKLNFFMMRQLGILNPERLTFRINVIGAGAVGAATAIALTKMGCSDLLVWDPDKVGEENIATQFYNLASIGMSKVEALARIVEQFSGEQIQAIPSAFTGEEEDRLRGVVISAVDSMEARATIWRAVRLNPAVGLLIDSRLGAEIGLIYTIRPTDLDDIRFYEATLHSDEESAPLPCTARGIIYNSLVMAGLVANQVKKFALGEPLQREIMFDLKNLSLLPNALELDFQSDVFP